MRTAVALRFTCAVAAVAMTAPLVMMTGALVAGCRATPEAPQDDLGVDLSVGGGDDLAGDDLAVADLAGCPVGPEVCGNGCDDDRNGYIDADDPACTSQMLVTLSMGSPQLWRLILEPKPHVVVLDGNPIATNGAMATYDATFAKAAFLSFDSGTKLLQRVPLGGGGITSKMPMYTTRDVCVFNGELIVVAPGISTGTLHRFMSDGMTEIMPPVAMTAVPTACSSDGNLLYVANHPQIGDSVISVFGKSASGPVDTGVNIAMPDALLNAGYTRIVDLVYVKKGGVFIGLFAMPSSGGDSALDGEVMAPFSFDGGVGDYIDGGVWHGVGEFMP